MVAQESTHQTKKAFWDLFGRCEAEVEPERLFSVR